MSKQQAIKTIRSEIARVNQEIDLRIIKGVSYRREALRHKTLMSQLARLEPQRSWLSRSMSVMAMFMF
ncbi:MAG: hypothetical protein V4481_00790 [Patescibacteria group bacterium]